MDHFSLSKEPSSDASTIIILRCRPFILTSNRQRVREELSTDKSLKQHFMRDCVKESIRMYTNLNVPSRYEKYFY